ncbi:integrase catalytic domain-containing protein [Trichonephila clavipes]|nr:integrase catalytic domain-containing protein [Trichonephila clavipes]
MKFCTRIYGSYAAVPGPTISSQTYAQAAKSSNKNSSTQTDENITKIKCSPLKLLEPFSSKPNASISTPNVTRSSSSTQAQLLLSTSSIPTAYSESQPLIPTSNDAPSTNDMFTSIGTSSPIIPTSSSHSVIQPPSASHIQDTKKISKVRGSKEKKKELLKKMKDAVIEIKMAQHRPRKPASVEYTTDEEDIIVYDMGGEIESPKNGSTLMGNLPRDRVVPDYPYNCSAIHIEIVSDLTSDAFIATLKRFFSRRGKCAKLYSDNGKTFVGANKELKRFLKLIEDSDDNLAGFLSAEGIEWKFIPPRAPSLWWSLGSFG